jgi:predicted ATPase/DNA-binding XRE family transcriptional regulator
LAEVTFGEWLKRQRGAQGWTQEQLAQKIHCSTSALRKFESEERRPSKEVVEQLADVFNIPGEERESFLHFARGDWQAFSSSYTESTPWHETNMGEQTNLPSSINSFIGRQKEQEDVIHLLKAHRLVTLSGMGGIGKTRLAVQVGHQLLHDYPHGVWFVALDSLSNPSRVPQTVGAVFHIREGPNRPIMETLNSVLRRKTLLLILDNCEHLLNACGELIRSLLIHCPNLKILTTSRELLKVEGEATYYLPSLTIPETNISVANAAEYESIQLFTDRASLTLSTFVLTRENTQSIVEICQRVEGIPLAIELTAARVDILRVEEISKQLRKSFAILANDSRTKPSHHQTLQASLDWSWSLLTEVEQVFLCELAVFAGGWTLEAAETVCDGDALNLIQALVQKSLIQVQRGTEHETRYHFHEMVRQYMHDKLHQAGDAGTIRDRHLAYFVKLVEQAEPELYRSKQVFWFRKLDAELDNFRAAMEWASVRDIASGLRIAITPWRFWHRRNSCQELLHWLQHTLESYPKSDSLRAQALAVCSAYSFVYGNAAEARKFAEQGLELARSLSDRQNEALSLLFLGRSIAFPGNYMEGNPLLKQSLELYRALADKTGQAMATGWLGMDFHDLEHSKSYLLESLKLHRELGNLSEIAWCLSTLTYQEIMGGNFYPPPAWLEEAKKLYRELGDQVNEADALATDGILAYRRGDYQQAYPYFEQAIALYDNVAGTLWSAWPRAQMAHAFIAEGNYQQARENFEVCLQQFRKIDSFDYFIGVVFTIEGLGRMHLQMGQLERATRLFAWADAMREKLNNRRPPVEQADVRKDITTCLARMGEAAFSDAYDQGKKMSLEDTIACALEES